MSIALCIPQFFDTPRFMELSPYMITQDRWDLIEAKEIVPDNTQEKQNDLNVEQKQKQESFVISFQESDVTSTPTIQVIQTTDSVQTKMEKYTLQVKKAFDPLFWSLFVAHFGMNEFLRVGVNNGNEEMKLKNQIIDYLLQKGAPTLAAFTNYKFTKAFMGEIIHSMQTHPKTELCSLVAMSLYFEADIYVVNAERNIYLPFTTKGAKHTYVLYVNPLYHYKHKHSSAYFVDVGEKVMKIHEIHDKMIGLLHYEKPLKGVSAYKTIDLEEMAEKVGVDSEDEKGKSLKKQELYTKILLKCVWEKEVPENVWSIVVLFCVVLCCVVLYCT